MKDMDCRAVLAMTRLRHCEPKAKQSAYKKVAATQNLYYTK